jgi:hypothetical protein
MSSQFQIDSLNQSKSYLNSSLQMPEPIDSNLLKIPEAKRSEFDLAQEASFHKSADALIKRASGSQQ